MNYFQRYLAEEFAEEYQEGRISRREALRLIVSVTGSMAVANTILAACAPAADGTQPAPIPTTGADTPTEVQITPAPNYAPTDAPAATPAATQASQSSQAPITAGTVRADDPDIQARPVEFPGEDGAALTGYLARPVDDGPHAVVLVCHENRGLTAHIEDVTRRLAKAGYAALAVDLLAREGGTASIDPGDVPGRLGNIEPDQFVQDFVSGWRYLGEQPFAKVERVGMVGFCFGGGVTWRMATRMPELLAAVPFYGPHPPLEDVPNIQAAVLAIYGGKDTRINQGIPAIEEAMRQHGKTFEKVIYPDADHAFHNDTGTRYDPQAARDAWARTLDWFARYLG